MKGRGAAADSIVLAIVKFITIATGMACTMILSRALSLEEYGTFVQANLIVSIASAVTVLGLTDACNFFYNFKNNEDVKKNINTIFAIELFIGIATAACIIIFGCVIVKYFDNPLLAPLLLYVAFRPMLSNMIASLQVLVVSVGRARAIAIRNIIVSLMRLGVVALTAFVTKDILTIFVAYLVVDVFNVIWFAVTYSKGHFFVNPGKGSLSLVKPILVFSIPMAAYILFNSLSRELDKVIIGGFESTDVLAIYSNCAAVLPFEVISASFLTVLIPIFTRYLGSGETYKAQSAFREYLRIGYLTTFAFGVVCFVLSESLVSFLYGEKYLPGLPIFQLYLTVDMIRFASLSLVLAAKGKTKDLMWISVWIFVLNFFLSFALYFAIGWFGPAVATVVSTVVLTVVLMRKSMMILQTRFSKILPIHEWLPFFLKLILVAGVGLIADRSLIGFGLHQYISMVIVGFGMIAVVFLFVRKDLKMSLSKINAMR